MKAIKFLTLLLLATPVWAVTLPELDGYQHSGVATCATSNCHGKSAKDAESNVWLNEYRLWSSDDYHSRAYQVLRNDESKAMAKALGLPNAQNAKICLDCHADNVPTDVRGEKFQISDGVGCEACHGGSQNWLKSHTDPDATHEDNISRGLYPLSDPLARAQLCLSCHLGTKDKFTTHAIMAAGHPRLAFELDTYTANQPAHYAYDDDYKLRKRDYPVGYLWLVGQLEAAKRQLELIEQYNLHKSLSAGMVEFSIYDCHSCHQPMNPLRGRPNDLSAELPSGGLRLLDHSFDMLSVVYQVLEPNARASFNSAVSELHQSYNQADKISTAIDAVRAQISTLESTLVGLSLNNDLMKTLRRTMAQTCASGRFADYSSAEQAFLAMEAISYSVGDRGNLLTALNKVYETLSEEHVFDPSTFASACGSLRATL